MSIVLNFIPVRISDDDGINLFVKNLPLYNEEFLYDGGIVKKISYYVSPKFILKYTEYKLPTEFTMVSFVFNNELYFHEFINSNYYHIKGLINVTDNHLFCEENIGKHSICDNKFIVEGVKGVGKSSLINYAIDYGIICQDRDMKYISNGYYDGFPVEKRAMDFYEYIHGENNLYCLFLMNNDFDSLMRRINYRDRMNQKDVVSEKYRDFSKLQLYIDKYRLLERYMKEHGLIDERIDFVNCEADNVIMQNKRLLKIMKSK